MTLQSKKIIKHRYYYPYNEFVAEIDIFDGALKGLVVIDFEFQNSHQKNSFITPDFCLVDITSEEFIAGGFLAGKSYQDIDNKLKKIGYKRLEF